MRTLVMRTIAAALAIGVMFAQPAPVQAQTQDDVDLLARTFDADLVEAAAGVATLGTATQRGEVVLPHQVLCGGMHGSDVQGFPHVPTEGTSARIDRRCRSSS